MEATAGRSITAILLVVIVAMIVHQCSQNRDESGHGENRATGPGHLGDLSSRKSSSESRITRSDRKEPKNDLLDFEVIDVESDESVLFQISDLETYDGIHLHLHALKSVDEDGTESISLAPKVFDATEALVPGGMPEEDQHQRFFKESDRQVFFRQLSRIKGLDIMTGYSQRIEEGGAVEIVCVPGKEQLLMIDAKVERGKGGRLKLRFGEPYLRARVDAAEILRSVENPE